MSLFVLSMSILNVKKCRNIMYKGQSHRAHVLGVTSKFVTTGRSQNAAVFNSSLSLDCSWLLNIEVAASDSDFSPKCDLGKTAVLSCCLYIRRFTVVRTTY